MTWTIAIVVVLALFIAWQLMKPGLRRKQAVAAALARAQAAAAGGDPQARLELARVKLELAGDAASALDIAQDVDRKNPRFWNGKDKPAKVVIAEAYVGMGKLDLAIRTFEEFVAGIGGYAADGATGNADAEKERKWRLETYKVDAEQRIRLLKKGDTHVHAPEHWGDNAS